MMGVECPPNEGPHALVQRVQQLQGRIHALQRAIACEEQAVEEAQRRRLQQHRFPSPPPCSCVDVDVDVDVRFVVVCSFFFVCLYVCVYAFVHVSTYVCVCE